MAVPTAGQTSPLNVAKWRRKQVSTGIIVITIATLVIQVGGFLYAASLQERLNVANEQAREFRAARAALVDSELAVEGYVHSGDPAFLAGYLNARKSLDERRPQVLRIDIQRRPGAPTRIDRLSSIWSEAISSTRAGAEQEGQRVMAANTSWVLTDGLRRDLDAAVARHYAEAGRYERGIRLSHLSVVALQLLGGSLTLAGLLYAFRAGAFEARARRRAVTQAVAARGQIEQLFEMTDMLQSASGHADANAVLRATADKLLPDLGGALYVFNNSRDRMDLSIAWGGAEDRSPETISPGNCWALKRGKAHRNLPRTGALRCEHHLGDASVQELPMMARGEVYGLLQLHAEGPDAEARLTEATPLATALADAMSLALSNIALRERLRNQALRDPLTGLYNRRYMEDMLERFTLMAERSQTPVAVIMIDLDHFKRLNDEHGHAMGDAVLRETAATITGALRNSDVACRYGGEELVVLLPDCDLESAMAKAEVLRARIEGLSDLHDVRVTASFGVASMPETTKLAADLIPCADAALYQSKQTGRNRVTAARRRADPVETLAGDDARHAAE